MATRATCPEKQSHWINRATSSRIIDVFARSFPNEAGAHPEFRSVSLGALARAIHIVC